MRYFLILFLFSIAGCLKKQTKPEHLSYEQKEIFIEIEDEDLDSLPEAEDTGDPDTNP